MAGLKLTGLKKAYGDVQTLHGIVHELVTLRHSKAHTKE